MKKKQRMKNKYLTILLPCLLPLLMSCQEDKGRPLIEEERMAHIIADYYMEQSTLTQFPPAKGDIRFYYYSGLVEKYGCTEEEFDSSVVWYTKNLDVYEKVYNQVEKILEARKDSILNLIEIQKSTAKDTVMTQDTLTAGK